MLNRSQPRRLDSFWPMWTTTWRVSSPSIVALSTASPSASPATSPVAGTRVWSWLALALLVVEGTRGLVWIARHGAVIPVLGRTTQGYEYIVGAVLLAMLAYPVFLLVFLARRSIRDQYAGWPS